MTWMPKHSIFAIVYNVSKSIQQIHSMKNSISHRPRGQILYNIQIEPSVANLATSTQWCKFTPDFNRRAQSKSSHWYENSLFTFSLSYRERNLFLNTSQLNGSPRFPKATRIFSVSFRRSFEFLGGPHFRTEFLITMTNQAPWPVRKGIFRSSGQSDFIPTRTRTPSPIVEMPLSPPPLYTQQPQSPSSPRVTITESPQTPTSPRQKNSYSPPLPNGKAFRRNVRDIPIEVEKQKVFFTEYIFLYKYFPCEVFRAVLLYFLSFNFEKAN